MSADMKKVVVKVDVHDNKDKKVARRAVSSLQGDRSMEDTKNEKLTVIGIVDPHECGGQAVRKHWCAEMVGPATEPEKKEEEAKKGEREKKKDADAMTTYYYVQSAEENPSA